jgi:hypothetical protein
MNKPFIRKVLDISTAHITETDNEVLRGKFVSGFYILATPIACDPIDGGFYVYLGLGNDAQEVINDLCSIPDDGPKLSSAFMSILNWAKNLECDIIKFDCDGTIYDDLTQFKW